MGYVQFSTQINGDQNQPSSLQSLLRAAHPGNYTLSLSDQEPWDTRINKESVSIILIMKCHYSDLNILPNADLSKAYATIIHGLWFFSFFFFLLKPIGCRGKHYLFS